MSSSISAIKRAQKESQFFREISQLYLQAALDDSRLQGIVINRVQLSPDKGTCTVFFYTAQGEEHFNKVWPALMSYKGPLRKALAATIRSRYTPDLVFIFDKHFEKQQRIESLIEQVRKSE